MWFCHFGWIRLKSILSRVRFMTTVNRITLLSWAVFVLNRIYDIHINKRRAVAAQTARSCCKFIFCHTVITSQIFPSTPSAQPSPLIRSRWHIDSLSLLVYMVLGGYIVIVWLYIEFCVVIVYIRLLSTLIDSLGVSMVEFLYICDS